MIFNWLDSRTATQAGTALADFFVAELAANKLHVKKQHDPMQRLFAQANCIMRDLRLNIYEKAKLANAFKWKLLDMCLERACVDEITMKLLQYLWFGRDSGRGFISKLPDTTGGVELLFSNGNEHLARGAHEQAIICYENAIKLNPRYAAAHNNLGCALYTQGRLAEAEASFRKALEIEPEYADAHSNLGNTLLNRGRLTEAESSLRLALGLKPDHANALHTLGSALTLLGRFNEAETCYKRVLKIKPDHADALVGMGHAVSYWGRFEEAEAFFQRALTIKPKMSAAWASIVSLRKMTLDDAAWLTTAEEIVQARLEPLQELSLRFAMGKYCDDTKDFERAFLNYRRANELLNTVANQYDRQKQTLFVDDMIRVYDQERISKVQDGASASARPVFIVGMMRSGTSLTEQIIASHPLAMGAGELSFWCDSFDKHEKTILEATLGEPVLHELADEYLRHLSGFSIDATRIVDKAPGNFAHLGLIHSAFPNARIIHMQRNPIDTCLSIYFQHFSTTFNFANDLADLAHYYREYHRLMAHWRAVLPPGVLMDVPYEALAGDQEEWSRKIVEFIGLDWDERCLDFNQTKRRVGTASNWQVRQKMYGTSIERWRNYEKFVEPLMGLMDLSR